MPEKMTTRQMFSHILRAVGIIRRLMPWYFTLTTVASALRPVQPLFTLYFSARIIDELSGSREPRAVALYAALTVGLSFLLKLADSLLTRKISVIKSTQRHKLMQLLGERYAGLDYEHVEDARVNDLLAGILGRHRAGGLGLNRVINLLPRTIERFFGAVAAAALLVGAFSAPVKGDGTFIASGAASWLLVAATALPIAVRVFVMKRARKAFHIINGAMEGFDAAWDYYREYAMPENAGKDIRLYSQRPFIMNIYNRIKYSWYPAYNAACSEVMAFTGIASAAASGFAYILIGLRALAGMYTIGQVTQYVGAMATFLDRLTGVISDYSMLGESVSHLPAWYEYLDLPDGKYLGTLTTEKRADNDYELEFHDVSFQYPGTDTYALKNLNLKINVGERLAVVGRNGSGKTTMIKLLCRLYDPTEGYITLNRIDIKKYDYEEYMGIFSVVFQDFKLPAFSLGQNVAAAVDYDGGRVRTALEKMGFDAASAPFDGDLDTSLYKSFDENGVAVSGGEAQKIALARAIYKSAPFVILDEPTAALDPVSEYEIYSKFSDIVENKTAVFISHRLSSCRFCHDIAVFHEGELVQRGGHEELLADTHGKYYELWNAQAQYYVAG